MKNKLSRWYVGETHSYLWIHDGENTIAKVVNRSPEDASLIAAAPDLFSVCEFLALIQDGQFKPPHEIWHLIMKARQAVAKVRDNNYEL